MATMHYGGGLDASPMTVAEIKHVIDAVKTLCADYGTKAEKLVA